MMQLTKLNDEYIDQPKLLEQKNLIWLYSSSLPSKEGVGTKNHHLFLKSICLLTPDLSHCQDLPHLQIFWLLTLNMSKLFDYFATVFFYCFVLTYVTLTKKNWPVTDKCSIQ